MGDGSRDVVGLTITDTTLELSRVVLLWTERK